MQHYEEPDKPFLFGIFAKAPKLDAPMRSEEIDGVKYEVRDYSAFFEAHRNATKRMEEDRKQAWGWQALLYRIARYLD